MDLKILGINAKGPGVFEAIIEYEGLRQQLDFIRAGPITWELTKEYSDLSLSNYALARALLQAVQRVEAGAVLKFPLELSEPDGVPET